MSDSYGTKEDKFCVDCKWYWFDRNEMTGNCELTIETTGKFSTCESWKEDDIIDFPKIMEKDYENLHGV